MKCKDNQLTKVGVLRKFVEVLSLKLKKISSLKGATYWRLVREHSGMIYHLYTPNQGEIYTFGPRTVILDRLFDTIPRWYERWQEKDVEFANPLFGCKSLEEAMLKLDLLDSGKPKKGK